MVIKKQCCPLCKLELINNNETNDHESSNQNNNVNQIIRIQLV
jgi:hypothetical protein